jgi:hypothetical protein
MEAVVKKRRVSAQKRLTQDKAFCPDPEANGISAAERAERVAIGERFVTVEEATCKCHRLVKMEEHVFTDVE